MLIQSRPLQAAPWARLAPLSELIGRPDPELARADLPATVVEGSEALVWRAGTVAGGVAFFDALRAVAVSPSAKASEANRTWPGW